MVKQTQGNKSMKRGIRVTGFGLLAISGMLAGCSTTQAVKVGADQQAQQAAAIFNHSKTHSVIPYEVRSGMWILGKPVPRQQQLPPALTRKVSMLVTGDTQEDVLTKAASQITQTTGIPVRVSLSSPKGSGGSSGSGAASSSGSSAPSAPTTPTTGVQLPSPPSGGFSDSTVSMMNAPSAGSGSQAASAPSPQYAYHYTGSLKNFLNILASRLNVSWQYKHGEILISRYETKVFTVDLQQGGTTLGSGTSGAQGGSSGGGTTVGSLSADMADVQVKIKRDVWKDLKTSINSMLTDEGSLSVSPSTGSVTVTDKGYVVKEVADYIEQLNERLTRQVALDIRILQVSSTDGDNYGVSANLSKIIGPGNSNVSIKTLGTLSSQGSLASVAASIVDTSSKFNGSQVLINALSQNNKVTQLSDFRLRLLNNQIGPFQNVRQQTYLAKSETTVTGTAGTATTTLEPGVVKTGLVGYVLPMILHNNRILLQYGIELSSSLGITTLTSGQQEIQAPDVEKQTIGPQQTALRSGQLLVLTGQDTMTNTLDQQGTGKSSWWFLGGGSKASKDHTQLLVLIEPELTNEGQSTAYASSN